MILVLVVFLSFFLSVAYAVDSEQPLSTSFGSNT